MVQKHSLQLPKQLLRELILLSGFKYNYMNRSSASFFTNIYVDHGTQGSQIDPDPHTFPCKNLYFLTNCENPWVLLSFLSDCSVFVASDKRAESTVIAVKNHDKNRHPH